LLFSIVILDLLLFSICHFPFVIFHLSFSICHFPSAIFPSGARDAAMEMTNDK